MSTTGLRPSATLARALSGERAIGSLRVGDAVTAYDPASGKTSTQTVQHVFLNHDTDLLDVTLAASDTSGQPTAATNATSKAQRVALASHGLRAPPTADTDSSAAASIPTETVHTTDIHPWLTTDKGWVLAGDLHLGERVVREDGSPATVVALRVVAGAADYYNLTVSQLHTYAVGVGQYVVHNCDDVVDVNLSRSRYPETASHIEDSVADGKPDELTVNRAKARTNRTNSLKDHPAKPGFDRDEYPLAMTDEGGTDADVRYIDPSDNRGAGSVIGHQLQDYPDGTRFRIVITE